MSYEPALIINKKHLNAPKVIEKLESERYCGDKEKEEVAEYLLGVANYKGITFGKLELVICEPEFTSFNGRVRHKLTKLKIDYRVSD